MSVKSLNLYDLKELSLQNEGLALIEMLQNFGVLHNAPKCIRGHKMTLTREEASLDKFKWKCREKQTKKKKLATIGKY